MIIHLPKEVESSILAEVQSGHFATVDEAVAAAWRAFEQVKRLPSPPTVGLGSIGAMRDAADELDQIVADAMKRRREEPWRAIPGE